MNIASRIDLLFPHARGYVQCVLVRVHVVTVDAHITPSDGHPAMFQDPAKARPHDQCSATPHALIAWFAGVISVILGVAVPAPAQVGPDGFDWVTIGAPGNRPFGRPDGGTGFRDRGSVPYEYRMARTELTTAQYLEYVNTFTARANPVPLVQPPFLWGATRDRTYTGPGIRYRLIDDPNAARMPVAGINWRQSAMFVNWLNNDKSSDPNAIRNGAYDISTFGYDPNGNFTDQQAHNPGARYWIPTLDEHMKASHYSGALDQWFYYPTSSDTAPHYGEPGMGDANSGFNWPAIFSEFSIPVGSYPQVTSPWGLLDCAGSTKEWTESIRTFSSRIQRFTRGSYAGGADPQFSDAFLTTQGQYPDDEGWYYGLRVASAIPAPSTCLMFVLSICAVRRRRRSHVP